MSGEPVSAVVTPWLAMQSSNLSIVAEAVGASPAWQAFPAFLSVRSLMAEVAPCVGVRPTKTAWLMSFRPPPYPPESRPAS